MTVPAASSVWLLALGEALVHFLWQGALVAVVLIAFRPLLNRTTARARYLWNCLALFSLPLLFAATLLALRVAGPAAGWTWLARVLRGCLPGFSSALLPYLVLAWALGVASLSVHSLGGWLLLQRARRRVDGVVPTAWKACLSRLRRQMGVRAAAHLGVSPQVQSPCVAGWWRPLILLPLSALAALPPEHLEALLAHELAHIRRHDYLVNLLQRAVEVLFFYHPAVWWISRQVAEEREHCCDDLAIAACGDRLVYARALVDMAEAGMRHGARQLVLAASGGSLRRRIRRIVDGRPADHTFAAASRRGALAAVAVAAIFGFALAGAPRATRGLRKGNLASMNMVRMASVTSALAPAPRYQAIAFRPPVKPPARKIVRAQVALPPSPAPRLTVVAFTWTAYAACVPRLVSQIEPQIELVPSSAGTEVSMEVAWVRVRTVVQCEPVLRPVTVWMLTTRSTGLGPQGPPAGASTSGTRGTPAQLS